VKKTRQAKNSEPYFTAMVTGGLDAPATVKTTGTVVEAASPEGTGTLTVTLTDTALRSLAAQRTIPGYEAMKIIRKGQVRWLSGSGVRRQNRFINELFEVAA
jgi:hypothetical protein